MGNVWCYTEQEDTIRCQSCGDACHISSLCHCCHRCTGCVAEYGHRRMRVVADELESYETGGES